MARLGLDLEFNILLGRWLRGEVERERQGRSIKNTHLRVFCLPRLAFFRQVPSQFREMRRHGTRNVMFGRRPSVRKNLSYVVPRVSRNFNATPLHLLSQNIQKTGDARASSRLLMPRVFNNDGLRVIPFYQCKYLYEAFCVFPLCVYGFGHPID